MPRLTKRKHYGNGTLWLELFVVLVMLTGYALYSTGHFEDPFSALGFRGFSDAGNFVVRRGGFTDDPTQIFLSQLGDVLFNVWFICAMTAVVIVVQKLGKLVVTLVRRRRSTEAGG